MVRANGEMKDLTTGRAAKIAGVAPRTLSKWVDSGRLRGYQIPGSRDRRIRPTDFAEFLRAHGMGHRIPLIGDTFARVLYVGFPASTRDAMPPTPYEPTFALSAFTAGIAMAESSPAVVVVDSAVGRIDARQIADEARFRGVRTVVIGEHVDGFDATGASLADAPALIAAVLLAGGVR